MKILKQRGCTRVSSFIWRTSNGRKWDLISASRQTGCRRRSARDITSMSVVSARILCSSSLPFRPSCTTNCIFLVKVKPLIKVTNQLVAAPVDSDVVLQCYVESSPKAMNTWYRNNGERDTMHLMVFDAPAPNTRLFLQHREIIWHSTIFYGRLSFSILTKSDGKKTCFFAQVLELDLEFQTFFYTK